MMMGVLSSLDSFSADKIKRVSFRRILICHGYLTLSSNRMNQSWLLWAFCPVLCAQLLKCLSRNKSVVCTETHSSDEKDLCITCIRPYAVKPKDLRNVLDKRRDQRRYFPFVHRTWVSIFCFGHTSRETTRRLTLSDCLVK